MKKLLVTLTPAEGKRLIAKGLLATKQVKHALKSGYLCVTLGSTSSYLVEEILGEYDKTRHLAGLVVPKGPAVTDGKMRMTDAIFHKGLLLEGKKVIDVLDELGPKDVIIKSANALGSDYIPIVLLASNTAGTIGTFLGAAAARNITVIMPVGLEKSIPASYNDFNAEFGMNDWDYAIGTPVGAISIPNTIAFTEIEALDVLFDVFTIPIAAGGLNGAEGAVTFYVSGDDKNIKDTHDFLLTIKGEPLFPHVKHVK
ncbi:MAG: hypothetical protein EAX81_01395 [Candidatus Thorarchaeota archaeon]|nr:hypothetical protein [Candidatus Thorarchaeota archaeon]